MGNKKDELMDATMRVISENGFGGFSMKQVTQLACVGETLVYKHFETKENLLHECFLKFHKLINEFSANYSVDEFQKWVQNGNVDKAVDIFKEVWMDYLDFLITNSFRTVYYFEYRDSIYVQNVLQKRNLFYEEHLSDFYYGFKVSGELFHLNNFDRIHIFWTHVLDGVGRYACKVIKGEIADTKENRELMWAMTYGGIKVFLD